MDVIVVVVLISSSFYLVTQGNLSRNNKLLKIFKGGELFLFKKNTKNKKNPEISLIFSKPCVLFE
jgi:hypothetical protein